jgi:hypothetical protein
VERLPPLAPVDAIIKQLEADGYSAIPREPPARPCLRFDNYALTSVQQLHSTIPPVQGSQHTGTLRDRKPRHVFAANRPVSARRRSSATAGSGGICGRPTDPIVAFGDAG